MKLGKLKNGIRYIIDENGSKYSANIIFMVGVGSRFEVKNKFGLAHFLEHMLFKGTKKRKNSKAISDEIYSCGATTNAMTTYDVTGYYITTASEHIEKQLDILSDMLFNSQFKGLKSEKDVVISENKMNETAPDDKLVMLFNNLIFNRTTFEHDTGGLNKDIRKFTKKDVVDFYNKYYSPDNIVLSICGKVPKNINKLIEKYFDKKRKNIPVEKETYNNFRCLQTKPRFKSVVKDVDQAQIMIGFPSYNYNNRKYYILEIISSILGGNMSSKLFITLREKLGLVYTIQSDVDGFEDLGMIAIKFGTFLKKVKKSIEEVINQIVILKKKGISKKLLDDNVNFLIGLEAISNEDNETVAYQNAYEYLIFNKIVDFNNKKKIYKSITVEEANEVINEIFDYNRLNCVIIADKKYKNFIKEF